MFTIHRIPDEAAGLAAPAGALSPLSWHAFQAARHGFQTSLRAPPRPRPAGRTPVRWRPGCNDHAAPRLVWQTDVEDIE